MEKKKNALSILQAGTSQILPQGGLEKKLASGKRLKIKFGADPTAPDLHLGHAVVLSKLKEFQDLGHDVIFLIGDFTARIGDPTGKSKTRPPLTEKEIEHNTKTYFEQVGKILDSKKLTVRFNSEWLDKLTSRQVIELCGKLTLARLTEREDFASRIKKQQSIGLHELLYPVFQGYDSVELRADVELGGTDQLFNMLLGRFLQEQYGVEPQVVLTMPLLEGLDGEAKMSKSLGNAVGLTESADQAYGQLMSISDELMWRYLELLLNVDKAEISQMQERMASGNLNPMGLKKDMAYDIIASFWSEKEAKTAQKTFESIFQKRDYSKAQEVKLPPEITSPVWIALLLKALGVVKSSSEAKRLIEAGAVSINGQQIDDFGAEISWKIGDVIKAGKHRIYKLI
jgi:tyrosyl-tRNA synthetase